MVTGQKGSHVKLKRIVGTFHQILIVPKHKILDVGTTKAIFNQAFKYINQQELRLLFYSK